MMHLLSKVKTKWIFCGFHNLLINNIIGLFRAAGKEKEARKHRFGSFLDILSLSRKRLNNLIKNGIIN
jgi:hypothetical protein